MTFHLKSTEHGSPLASMERYTLGMPHLCPGGLSENWLWKELGHRHWELIGRTLGRAASGFGREGEQPVYAAFRRISLERGDLGLARENDVLTVHSILSHLSGTRVISRHCIALGDHPIANAEMTSVFIQRRIAGENRSVARIRIGHCSINSPGHDIGVGETSVYEKEQPDESTGDCELGRVIFDPCPQLDFNGAGLLYFSSYLAAVDRAEWQLWGKSNRQLVTHRRHAVFYANIDIGDRLLVCIRGSTDEPVQRHRALVYSEGNHKLLAEIVTIRTASSSSRSFN